MTVQELIKELEKLPQGLDVLSVGNDLYGKIVRVCVEDNPFDGPREVVLLERLPGR